MSTLEVTARLERGGGILGAEAGLEVRCGHRVQLKLGPGIDLSLGLDINLGLKHCIYAMAVMFRSGKCGFWSDSLCLEIQEQKHIRW